MKLTLLVAACVSAWIHFSCAFIPTAVGVSGRQVPYPASGVRAVSGAGGEVLETEVVSEAPEGLSTDRLPGFLRNMDGRSVFQRRPEELQVEIERLSRDIVSVARQTGGRVGFRRSLQATAAVLTTVREILKDTRANGGRSTADSLRKLEVKDAARYLRILFENLGSTYVKVGQFIASSPTLFPAEYVMEFQKCLDSTDPVPFSVINRIIQEELGSDKVSSEFIYIDPKPLASASIAQVHRAKLTTGEEVVLKVLKPGTEDVLKADLGFMFIASRVVELLQPELARTSFSAIVGDIRESMLEELDFRKEADNIDEFRTFLRDSDITEATAPLVYRRLSTSRVLTMERLKGVPLTDIDGIRARCVSPEATLITALNTWSLSVTQCNSFHADVHSGNLLVMDDGRVGFVDFGIVGRIPRRVWQSVRDLSSALVAGDYEGMARALVLMGATNKQVDISRFSRDIEAIFTRLAKMDREVKVVPLRNPVSGRVGVQSTVNFDSEDVTRLLVDIVGTAEDNGLKLPREFGLLIKQALYFDRYTRILAPDVDVLRDDRIKLPDGGSGGRWIS